ncbi:MAG: ATP-binding protein [Planctomycetia bacterium]|nr:ATP-binding protein [Planctomycetia bacterium]
MAKAATGKEGIRKRAEADLAAAIEGLGVFYLGTACDDAGHPTGTPLLVDARRFTTHAICVGMTGSGKTGLLVGLIEEAALDGIPTLVIDPKGDLANVLLAFPDLAPADFLPWVDPETARRDGVSLEDLAARTAEKWAAGLKASGQSGDRIRRLHQAAEFAVYTPGSRSGRPLAMLGSLEAPSAEILADPEARRERIESLVSGILALVGIDAEPGTSRDHVLLSTIVENLWKSGQKVDFGTLVRTIPTPPIDRVGFLDLENFYPAGDRFQLATRLNTVAAAPGFEAWLEGEPLDVGRLLWSPAGKPRVAVVSIAHLAEAQRMAFVTLLAGQTVAWMRSQGGTSSLKALFLMDEVFGYVPPVANPPSKTPILTLMKQARAYGLGVVLATQNPVDLDYKGLSNAGLWFLGRLQTARDKARVLDGLEGAAATAGGSFDRGRLDRLLSGLEQRRFLMHSVHGDEETLFQTRWTMSYLRGPLLKEEIRRLSADDPAAAATSPQPEAEAGGAAFAGGPRPILPPGVREVFLAPTGAPAPDGRLHYEPYVLGRAIVRYSLTAAGIDEHRETICLAPAGDSLGESAWEAADVLAEPPEVEPAPRPGSFAPLPAALAGPRGYASLATSLKGWLGRTANLAVWRATAIDAVSRPGEDERAFRSRITHRVHEWRDAEMERVRSRQAAKLASVEDRLARARQKVEKEKAEAQNQSLQTYVSIGSAVLGALFGRRKISSTTIGKAATSMRTASRAARQQADVAHAEESLSSLEEKRRLLEDELEAELERIRLEFAPDRLALERVDVPARKTGTTVEDVVLAWVPRRERVAESLRAW